MKNKKSSKISVIIPIFNEAANLAALIKRLEQALSKTKFSYELIFVDDNSTDKTNSFFKNIKKRTIVFLKKQGRQGKAYSLIEGFEKARGDIIAMIDGDLQYPPEAIPVMIKELKTHDIVVAERVQYNDSKIRRVLSKTFRNVFGKKLFGLDHDVQSGLKVFKREIIDAINFYPTSPWTFDLEFLHRARNAGFTIKSAEIEFSPRQNGTSKVKFLATTFEIGANALKLRSKKIDPVHFAPKTKNNMLGAGIGFRGNKYITHTKMPHHFSALKTFTTEQKAIAALCFLNIALGLYIAPLITLQVVIAILTFIYFADVIFNFYLVAKSLHFPSEISFSNKELDDIDEKTLPIYTILCPLYRESHIIPSFLKSISKLSWPKDKLDVILLLEEDDQESIEVVKKMKLPSYVRALVVPHSAPKTKPKACNYGLAHAKGEYLVIYDAEDIPDPMQLKKAYLGFEKAAPDTICLQAKLNYYNPNQNLLTRFFTAEYSLWFDVTLTGLQSLETTIPLGGTSNHFRIKSLHEVEGWDPFNVTEDADLGVRLFKKGYKTAIIDSTTLEEANSNWHNWLRQRSRWIKGYMQTYLVHTREIHESKMQQVHNLIFHLVVGGKIAFVLINPILWAITFSYFAFYALIGPQIEVLYPPLVFYMAVFSLVFGNFLFLIYYMVGVAKREQWELMKYTLLVPLYWLAISIAAFIALKQLILKPHYWEKTLHGLHLKNEAVKSPAIQVAQKKSPIKRKRFKFAGNILKPIQIPNLGFINPAKIKSLTSLSGGAMLVAAGIISNFLNYLTSAYLGRQLEVEEFALISLLGSFLFITQIPASGISQTASHQTAYLLGKYKNIPGELWSKYKSRFISISVLLSIVWIILIPFLQEFFNSHTFIPFLVFSPMWIILLVAAVSNGFLKGALKFNWLAILVIVEAVSKLIFSVLLIELNLDEWIYISMPLSLLVGFLGSWLYAKTLSNKIDTAINLNQISDIELKFSRKFFATSVLTKLSSISFLSLDLVIVKHFMSATDAGHYALLILVGRMVYMVGGLSSQFILPIISKEHGEGSKNNSSYYKILFLMLTTTSASFIFLGPLGHISVPLLLGEKTLPILQYLTPFALSMILFSVAYSIVTYHQAKREYLFALPGILTVIAQVIFLYIFHANIGQIVMGMMLTGLFFLISSLILHFSYARIKKINIDINPLSIFQSNTIQSGNLRILIFNWRDKKHDWAGGAEVYVHELAKRLVKEGKTVTLFCGNSSNNTHHETIDGIEIYRRGGFFTVYIWAFIYYALKFRGKYDIIIDSENGIPFFTPLFAKEKVFLLIHHVHQEVFRKSLPRPLAQIALFLEAKLMPFVYRDIQVITVSPSSKEAILKYKLTKSDPIIIYNGVDIKPHLIKKDKNPLILYIGRLQYYKSLNVFVVAAQRILKKYPNAEFIIAGEGEQKNKLIKYAKYIGIADKIKFVGRVSEEEKIKLMQKAWVFVNPSIMEGWGITTMEAAACGTPTVASDVPGLRDSVRNGETGYLVRYRDYSGFTKSILKIIEDSNTRKSMSDAASEWARNFSWENSTKNLLSLIASYGKGTISLTQNK